MDDGKLNWFVRLELRRRELDKQGRPIPKGLAKYVEASEEYRLCTRRSD